MERNERIPPPPRPSPSQFSPNYQVTVASVGLAFTLTTMQPTQPNLVWYEKIITPLHHAGTEATILINQAPRTTQKKLKPSRLSAIIHKLHDTVSAEEWANTPVLSSADIDRNVYGV